MQDGRISASEGVLASLDDVALAVRLIEAARNGRRDGAAETALCARWQRRIYGYGLRHLKSPQAAADLTHDVLLIVLVAMREQRLVDPEGVPRFVLATCRNRAFESHRTQQTRAQILERRQAEFSEAAVVTEEFGQLDHDRVHDCLGKLVERDRSVLTLTFFEDKAASDIAASLSLKEGNVRVIRHRALLRLKGCVEGAGLAEEAS